MNSLPNKIKQLREAQGLTQEQLGALAGIAQEFVSEIETGRKRPSIEVLEKLCDALGCSADYLLGIAGSKHYSVLKEEGPFGGLSQELLREIEERNITEEDLRLALKFARVMQEEKK